MHPASYLKRISKILLGLVLYAFGITLSLNANIGLAPWDAFTSGLALRLHGTYGFMSIASGLVILAIAVLLKEKIGVGTILNTVLIGVFIDIFQAIGFVPKMENFLLGVLMLLAGQFIICCGTCLYMEPGMGCGPRDSLMVAIGRRLRKIPIGAIRSSIEAVVLLLGWLMGAKVGVGTVLAVFGMGTMLQLTCKLFRFSVRGVAHESLLTTLLAWKAMIFQQHGDSGKENEEKSLTK